MATASFQQADAMFTNVPAFVVGTRAGQNTELEAATMAWLHRKLNDCEGGVATPAAWDEATCQKFEQLVIKASGALLPTSNEERKADLQEMQAKAAQAREAVVTRGANQTALSSILKYDVERNLTDVKTAMAAIPENMYFAEDAHVTIMKNTTMQIALDCTNTLLAFSADGEPWPAAMPPQLVVADDV